jgi:hypothetical protein
MQPVMARGPDGTVTLLFLPPEFSSLLLELPALLDADDRPEVRSRRYQSPTEDDEEANAEWERMMHPDLFHLVAEARDIVDRDLEGLRRTQLDPIGGRLDIPSDHRAAWISAIQTVRVSLGAEHDVTAEDMEDVAALAEPGERSRAILRIHVLGDLQGLLIQESDPLAAGDAFADPDEDDESDEEDADDAWDDVVPG